MRLLDQAEVIQDLYGLDLADGWRGRLEEHMFEDTDSEMLYQDAMDGGLSGRYRYTRWMRIRPIDLVDVLVYLVVLVAFIQLFPDVISETFLLALLTAILLKVVLEVVLWAKKKIVARIRSADTRRVRIVSAITLLLVLPGSKVMVLGLVDLVFGDAVSLGGFFQVTALIIVLMLARGGVRWLFGRAHESTSA